MSEAPLDAREAAPLYALFSQLLLRELGAATIERLSDPEVACVLERAATGCRAWLAEPWTPERERAAREEFARLFLAPGRVPPFASAWLEGPHQALAGQLSTFATQALEALGRSAEPADEAVESGVGRPALDHAGLLCDLVAQAGLHGGEAGERIAAHLRRHALDAWMPRFGAALAEEARLPVYAALGTLLGALHAPDGPAAPERPNASEEAAAPAGAAAFASRARRSPRSASDSDASRPKRAPDPGSSSRRCPSAGPARRRAPA